MKSYTNLEQSKKLAEILPLESADMIWYGTYCGMDGLYHLLSDEYNEFGLIAINKEFCKTLFRPGDEYVDWLPCWSLEALLCVIQKRIKEYNILRIDIGEKDFAIWYDEIGYGVNNDLPNITIESAVDACVELIIKLKEKNLL